MMFFPVQVTFAFIIRSKDVFHSFFFCFSVSIIMMMFAKTTINHSYSVLSYSPSMLVNIFKSLIFNISPIFLALVSFQHFTLIAIIPVLAPPAIIITIKVPPWRFWSWFPLCFPHYSHPLLSCYKETFCVLLHLIHFSTSAISNHYSTQFYKRFYFFLL